MSKRLEDVGQHVEPEARTHRLIAHCRDAVTVAGTMRKSGLPTHGLKLLEGVLPVQLQIIHYRFHGGGPGIEGQSVLETLKHYGTVTPEQFEEIRNGLKAALHGSGRDIKAAIQAGLTLHSVICSPEFELARRDRVTRKQSRKPLLVRWASAAAGLLISGGAGHAAQ